MLPYALLWELCTAFFRIGLFTFGGGYAMLPLLEKEIIERRRWATRQEILDIYALAQSVPGAIGVNTAVFIGGRLGGVPGALAALLGVVTPSLLIILIVAHFFVQFQANIYIQRAFSGIRAAVVGLLGAAALRVSRGAIQDKFGIVVALAAFGLGVLGVIPVIWLFFLGGLAGCFYYLRKGTSGK